MGFDDDEFDDMEGAGGDMGGMEMDEDWEGPINMVSVCFSNDAHCISARWLTSSFDRYSSLECCRP